MLLAGIAVSFAIPVVSGAISSKILQSGYAANVGARSVAGTPKLWTKYTRRQRHISTTTCVLGHQPQQHDGFAIDELGPKPPTAATAKHLNCSDLASLSARSRAKSGDKAAEEDVELYFAYGANMSPAVLTGKRGVKPVASLPAEVVAFGTADPSNVSKANNANGSIDRGTAAEIGRRGICTCFCHRAGFATIMPLPGPSQTWDLSPGAHGVIHVVSRSDVDIIASSETGYKRCLVEVETSWGERVQAVCFVSDPMQMLPTSVPPTSRYLALLQDGASYHNVNERYQCWLAAIPSVPSKDAETSPERTNTPMKAMVDRALLSTAAAAAAAAIIPSLLALR